MKNSVIAGVVLGVAVVVWALIFGGARIYESTGSMGFIAVAILINIGVVIWGLFRTRAEGRGYGGQIVAALVMAVVASVLIFLNSVAIMPAVFPDYVQDVSAADIRLMESMGAPQAQVDVAREAAAGQTNAQAALGGVFGTVGTTLVVALIAAAFIRKKA